MGRIKAGVAEKVSAKYAKSDGMHAVGDPPGLYLYVAGDARSWILRYSFAGRRRDLGLGSYGDLTLAEAREKARTGRKLILDGIDPIEAKRERRDAHRVELMRRMTFADCVDGYLKAHATSWKNVKHRAQWRTSLDTYTKKLSSLNVAAITTDLVLQVLEPIWATKTETASRVRGRVEKVLDWATVRKFREGPNAARWKGNLSELLPARGKIAPVEHQPALEYAQIGDFMQKLRTQDGIAASALEFAILTATRSGEVRGALWSEIDTDASLWVIPGARMKAGREHRVPLSDDAAAVVDKMRKQATGDFIFPGAREARPLSDMSLTAVLRRMKRDGITVHGFRSTFRDWAAERTSYPNHVVEMALAHTIGDKVEKAYRRGDLFEKRARLMAEWARYCATTTRTADVVAIKGGRS